MFIDDTDWQKVYGSDRNLLYVPYTLARDQLLETGVNPTSKILESFKL